MLEARRSALLPKGSRCWMRAQAGAPPALAASSAQVHSAEPIFRRLDGHGAWPLASTGGHTAGRCQATPPALSAGFFRVRCARARFRVMSKCQASWCVYSRFAALKSCIWLHIGFETDFKGPVTVVQLLNAALLNRSKRARQPLRETEKIVRSRFASLDAQPVQLERHLPGGIEHARGAGKS